MDENEVKDAIEQAQFITILTHLNPDADTLGTALGIYALLNTEKGKKVEIVNASNVLPLYLDFLPNYKKIKSKMDYSDSLVITCDGGSIDRFGFDLHGRKIINIDHHKSNTRYGDINIVKEDYASASQVAFRLFEQWYIVNKNAAVCFYAALLSDTQYFTTTSVTVEVFEVAKSLISLGANPTEVAYNFTQRKPLSAIRILERSLSTLRLVHNAKIAIVYVTKEDINTTGATISDIEGIIDYAKSLVTVEIAICLMELSSHIRVSLRSKHVDVSQVALSFGGGGHRLAAGFSSKQCELQETIDTILKKIEELGLIDE